MKIVLATKNVGKLKEIREIFGEAPVVITSSEEEGCRDDVAESGITFEENALIKARAVYEQIKGCRMDSGIKACRTTENTCRTTENTCRTTGEEIKTRAETEMIVIADDSGLEVDFLNGMPGIYSSRFGGEGASDADRVNRLLNLLEGVPAQKRRARFVCAATALLPDGNEIIVRGECSGQIGFLPVGENGFGYDPVFIADEYGKTMAELDAEDKNRISHRGRAMKMLTAEIIRYYPELLHRIGKQGK
ncbi:MAG: non-canonical purine NTP pyrophosphatase [Clostridiales bacterium]|nr:non-canonical purine NTP pyrophosphatase [Clostridiales bacterium]